MIYNYIFRLIVETSITVDDGEGLFEVAVYARYSDKHAVVKKAEELKTKWEEDKYSGTDIEFAMLAKQGLYNRVSMHNYRYSKATSATAHYHQLSHLPMNV